MKHENENSSAYRPPEGTTTPTGTADAPTDGIARCPLCRLPLVVEPVTVRLVKDQPTIVIADVIRCVKMGCSKVPRRVKMTMEGRKNGMTEDQVLHLAKQQSGSLSFTKQELVSGRIAGYPAAPAAPRENPDRYIEPKEQKLF